MSKHKYQLIAAQLRSLIDVGKYPQGSKLPAHRELAKELGTTAVTVAKAYQLLVEQGSIESFVGRGSYVSSQYLQGVIRAQPSDKQLNFSILQPCLQQNMSVLKQLFRQKFNAIGNPQLFGYSENSGLLEHRRAGASWCTQYGLEVSNPEQLILTNGAQNALASIIALYSNQGDYIALEVQTYPGILAICKYLGRKVLPIAMDEQGMLPEALAQQCKICKPSMVIVVPSQQNPTAATMGQVRREALAKVIAQQDIWLVEDEIYAFLNTEKIPAISNFVAEKAFYISSLSKAISPGMRCGYLRVPKSQYSKVVDYIRATLWLPSPFMFEIASEMIDSGNAFRAAAQQKKIAAHRQQLVTRYLSAYKLQRQRSSYSCWLHLPANWQADSFTASAKKQGLLVSSAAYFNSGGQAANAVRLSVMAIADEVDFIQGLEQLAALLALHNTEF
ncbi:MAG: PLP-dependent aminotransferase family protein [Pseudomonadales bacterium]|nr:PLP-dependent aminotransferase family protein [Pseudomonadales bacterium]